MGWFGMLGSLKVTGNSTNHISGTAADRVVTSIVSAVLAVLLGHHILNMLRDLA